MDYKKTEMEVFKALLNAEKEGAEKERAKWERLFAEKEKATEQDEWVNTKEALRIIQKSSVNTLNSWVQQEIINPPRKIGRFNYWNKSNLLNLFGNGK